MWASKGQAAHARTWTSRLRQQAGFTMVETMIAAVLLVTGVLSTFFLIDIASGQASKARAREGATNLARELLEDAHNTSYKSLGQTDWFKPTLQGLAGGSGTVSNVGTNAQQTTVQRRGVNYTAKVSWCSRDDGRDNYGTHGASISWCSDSTTTTPAGDSQPEDLKRVTVDVDYSLAGKPQPRLTQVATFSATGQLVGPTTSNLVVQSPTTLGTPPVATGTSCSGSPCSSITFRGTSVGAADMKFAVEGVEQTSGVTNNGDGTFDFAWPISSLKDGVYTITATAVDALGTRGSPMSLQVKLNRGAPVQPQNVTGGYNNIYKNGVKQLAVELNWDANPEGTVTGYQVEKGGVIVNNGTSSACGPSQKTECIDLSPTTTAGATTTYTVKTLYTDVNGNPQSVSTSYTVTAPGSGVSTNYWATNSVTVPTTHCYSTVGGAAFRDLLSTAPTGSINLSTTGSSNAWFTCTPALPAAATTTTGTGSVDVYASNTGSKSGSMGGWVYNGATSTSIGSVWATLSTATVPVGSTPVKYTLTFPIPATTFNVGDQFELELTRSGNSQNITWWYGSVNVPTKLSIPTLAGSGSSLAQPATPTWVGTGISSSGGQATLTWNKSAGTTAADFYRIYRCSAGGTNCTDYTNRIDTAGDAGGAATLSWTDTNTGGVAHDYYVTAVSATLTESNFSTKVSG